MAGAFSEAFSEAFDIADETASALMANPLRIAYSNYADDAILSSGSGTIASLPISNLKDEDIQATWRTTDTAASQLLVLADLGGTKTIGEVAFINSNGYAPATFHVRVSTVDPTGVAGDAYNVSGIAGIVVGPYNKFVHFIEPAVSGRYVRINGNSLTTSPEAGRLQISDVWSPSRNVSLVQPPEEIPLDHTRVSYSVGGNRFQDIRARQRRYRFTLRNIPTSEKIAHIDEINRLRGIGRELLVCFDKDSANLGRESVWGHLMELLKPRRMAGMSDAWECDFELEERI